MNTSTQEYQGLRSLLIVVLICALVAIIIGVVNWVNYRAFESKQQATNAKMTASIKELKMWTQKMETAVPYPKNASHQRKRRKSPTELEKPKGPVPTSLIVESKRLASDPPAGLDVTSRPKKKRPKPSACLRPCNELAACSLKGDCSTLDTRKEDQVSGVCFDACQANETLKKKLLSTTDCTEFVEIARKRINGFTALCGPPRQNAK